MDNMDMERVHKVMELLEWRWHTTEGTPTLFDIRQRVRKDFKSAVERAPYEEKSVEGSGGFYYSIFREGGKVVFVDLTFVVAGSEFDIDWVGK